jgi:hypothetical protein
VRFALFLTLPLFRRPAEKAVAASLWKHACVCVTVCTRAERQQCFVRSFPFFPSTSVQNERGGGGGLRCTHTNDGDEMKVRECAGAVGSAGEIEQRCRARGYGEKGGKM